MSWFTAAVVLIVLFVLVVPLAALAIPQGRTTARSLHLDRQIEEVWSVITDYAGQASWRPDVVAVEPLPDRNGVPLWREVRRTGPPLLLEAVLADRPRRLVRRLADPELSFGGSWVFDLEPKDGGCVLTVTEKAEIYNPVSRFLALVLTDPSEPVETYLGALARKLQVDPDIRDIG